MAAILSAISGNKGFPISSVGPEALLGQLQNVSAVSLAAQITSAGAIEADIWPENTTITLPALAGSALEIVSNDPADTLAGTGAQKVTVTLLDTAFVRSTQELDMNGAGAVAVPGGPYLMCESALVTQVGTGRTNAGIIRVQVSGGGNVQSHMPIGALRSAQGFFGVAASEVAVVQSFTVTLGASATVRIRSDGSEGTGIIGALSLPSGISTYQLPDGIIFTASNRVRFTASWVAGLGNTASIIANVARFDTSLTA